MNFEAAATSEAMDAAAIGDTPPLARLASMSDLDSLSADLDQIDSTLAELNRPATAGQSSLS